MSFRLDRVLTLYFFYPLAKRFAPKKGVQIPILMYHSISDDPEPGIHPYFRINTPPVLFAEHMRFLHDNGYKVISLSTAVDLIKKATNCSSSCPLCPMPRKVVLTFDDGFKDFYTDAFPVIKKHGFTATNFLPTNFIEKGGPGLCGKKHLSWDEIRDLQKEGMEFGSHTCSHVQLAELETTQLEHEIRKSKRVIEEKTGRGCTHFSYPFRFPEQNGEFIQVLQTMLEKIGYECCLSTRIGIFHRQEDAFQLKRVPINSGDDFLFFRAKLNGRYDWLHHIQHWSKVIRARIS